MQFMQVKKEVLRSTIGMFFDEVGVTDHVAPLPANSTQSQ